MLSKLLQPEVLAFIKKHKNSDLDRLLFNKNKYPTIPVNLVVDQIRAKQKAKSKMPLWFNTEGIIMPPLLSMEQSSSEQAALYKSKFFKGDLAIDLTGGAGVDAFYLSKQFKKVIYIDLNKDLAEIAAYNFKLLGAANIEVLNANSEDFITSFKGNIDLIYIDPARRDQTKKLFLLEDCSPNILSLQSELLQNATSLVIKASPMLDITKGLNQLDNVTEVHVVAIKNEVKELLFIQSNVVVKAIQLVAVDLAYSNPFIANWQENKQAKISEALTYLYEPNAAILKTGKSDLLALTFNLNKLNTNTHLYTSSVFENNFPGRVFSVDKVLKYDKKEIKSQLPDLKANISVRNFPDSVDEIRKKTGIKAGGNIYIFAIRDFENKAKVLLCSKI